MSENKTPQDAAARRDLIRTERNRRNLFARNLGLSVTEMTEGRAVARMQVTDAVRNPIGSVHGGCLYTVADVACGAAVSSYGMKVTTVDSSIHFMRPGLYCTELIGRSEVIKHGKNLSVVDVTVEDETGTVLARGTFTFMSLGEPLDFVVVDGAEQ